MWKLLCWELLVTGSGHVLNGNLATGVFVFVFRLFSGLLFFEIFTPSVSIHVPIMGLIFFVLLTWISPFILYRNLAPYVSRKASYSSWKYTFLTTCWTGIGNSGYIGKVVFIIQLLLSITTHCIGVYFRVPLLLITILNSFFTCFIIVFGLKFLYLKRIRELPLAFILILILVGGAPPSNMIAYVRTYITDYYVTHNSMMSPTVKKGDVMMVDFQPRQLERGAIVLVDTSKHSTSSFRLDDLFFYQMNVQRVAGLPGDVIRIEYDGRMFVNDVPFLMDNGKDQNCFVWHVNQYFGKSDFSTIDENGNYKWVATPGPPWIYSVPKDRILCVGDKYPFCTNNVLSNMYRFDQIAGFVLRIVKQGTVFLQERKRGQAVRVTQAFIE